MKLPPLPILPYVFIPTHYMCIWVLQNIQSKEWVIIGETLPVPLPKDAPEGWIGFKLEARGGIAFPIFNFEMYGLDKAKQKKLVELEPEHQAVISEFKEKWQDYFYDNSLCPCGDECNGSIKEGCPRRRDIDAKLLRIKEQEGNE